MYVDLCGKEKAPPGKLSGAPLSIPSIYRNPIYCGTVSFLVVAYLRTERVSSEKF
jgi:hypothetical protein